MPCLGCSCDHAERAATAGRVYLSTRVAHTMTVLADLADLADGADGADGRVTSLAPGLLQVDTADPPALLTAARAALSVTEADEVRVVVQAPDDEDPLLAAAFAAPSLAQWAARTAHADLLPLFADEFGAFRSVYQPIVDLRAGDAVMGYEALMRVTGPTGPVAPADLFAVAAEAGWLHVLDRIGRTTALHGAAGWLGTAKLFVNFVPTTIYRPEVCLRTTELAAARAGLSLEQVVFEVTETERVQDVDQLSTVFDYYRARGCQVALDDLGSGYSSLNMLVRLQPDVVKLDKELVQSLPGATATAVVGAVVEMTHSYGGRVLAECVETTEQAEAARAFGVDLGQGWLFGRPEERTATPPGPTALSGLQHLLADPARHLEHVGVELPATHGAVPH